MYQEIRTADNHRMKGAKHREQAIASPENSSETKVDENLFMQTEAPGISSSSHGSHKNCKRKF